MRLRIVVAAVACLAAAVGCQKGPPEIATLGGRVTLDGKPVTTGIVNVTSEDDVTRTSAELTADGGYTIIGAPVGRVKLSVSTEDYRMILPEPGSGQTNPKKNPRFVAVPAKYDKFDTSGLTAVVGSGQTTHDIELSSK